MTGRAPVFLISPVIAGVVTWTVSSSVLCRCCQSCIVLLLSLFPKEQGSTEDDLRCSSIGLASNEFDLVQGETNARESGFEKVQ